MGKVRELRSAALVEINFTVCFKMFTGSWTVAFRDCHKVLREVVAKGLPSFQSVYFFPSFMFSFCLPFCKISLFQIVFINRN